ncbi:AI-2E family transporter [Novosphingobium huizhouense]|uniref:AI-2E family transporter n=1 Tax=Novosphingobium huizhouense TaxID=2866625 RepID=UPI00296E32EB|nr:AI-2E family transporter [Novosphingobium huizhouense]
MRRVLPRLVAGGIATHPCLVNRAINAEHNPRNLRREQNAALPVERGGDTRHRLYVTGPDGLGEARQRGGIEFMIERTRLEAGGLVAFVGLVTAGFIAVVGDFLGAMFWAAVAGIMFQPLFQRVTGTLGGRRSLGAAVTLLVITVAVILPLLLIGSMILDQAAGVYASVRDGQIDFARYFDQIHDALPRRLQDLADRQGLGSFERMRRQVSAALGGSVSVLANEALSFGRNAAQFLLVFSVGLYVTYFILRDGTDIGRALVRAAPLEREVAERLADRFVTVTRATVKGSVLVAMAQGALGAATFALVGVPAAMLWGLIMAFAALLPAIGPAIVWIPVAIYQLATGQVWQAMVVIFSGVAVVGMVDNLLRPLLVGRDTGIPDWLVLLSTLGGIALMGISGVVAGPIVAALFLCGWEILTEERERQAA